MGCAGQTIFPELLSEMRYPKHFPYAVFVSVLAMTVVYALAGGVGYHLMGAGAEYLNTYVTDHVSGHKVLLAVAQFLLMLHVLAGYVINGNVFVSALAQRFVPPPRRASTAIWLLASSLTVTGAFLVSNVLPSLGNLISVLGATCGIALTFLFPAAFALRLLDAEFSALERFGHRSALSLSVIGMIVCTVATVDTLVRSIRNAQAPFSC
jgi:hypothetical protein